MEKVFSECEKGYIIDALCSRAAVWRERAQEYEHAGDTKGAEAAKSWENEFIRLTWKVEEEL